MSSNYGGNRTPAASEDTALRWAIANALGEDRPNETNIYETFNWDRDPDIDDYYASFLRTRYGGPVVRIPAETAWRDPPDVDDEQDSEDDTEFEKGVRSLEQSHRIWNYGKRVDVLAGIGEFGVLVLEFDDITGPKEFREPVESAEELTGVRVFSQKSVLDIKEGGPGSRRWGEPIGYKLDLTDEEDEEDDTATDIFSSDDAADVTDPDDMWVHHSRVIHVPSDGLLDDEIRGTPRQEGVWNTITDIEKTIGSAAEMAYRASAWGLAINMSADVELEDDGEKQREHLQRWYHNLEPFLRTQGAEDIQNLGGADIDPAPIVDPNIEALAARTGIPQKVLKGNESGETAGSQDLREFYGAIQERREQIVTPLIVRALLDRLIEVGVLTAPTGGPRAYEVDWPPLAEQDEKEQSEIHSNRAEVAANLQTVVPGYGGDDWTSYVEEGEFPDVDSSPDIPPMNAAENAGAPPPQAQPPALADGGQEDGEDGDE